MSNLPYPRTTPWVWRLIVANAVVLLLLMTLFPALTGSLAFDPARAFAAPWTFVTYMFVHGGLFHLAFNMLLLFFLGSAVEQRMGSRVFILFYLYCGIGGPILSLLLSASGVAVAPFVGASAAVLGVAVAYAMYWPDAELIVFPLPFPIRAKVLITAIIVIDLVSATLSAGSGIAHWAHVGGALSAYLYLRFQSYSRPKPVARPRTRERVLVSRPEPEAAVVPEGPERPARVRRRLEKDPDTIEIDRVLDKISATGIDSLTDEERRFLEQASQRKQDDPPLN